MVWAEPVRQLDLPLSSASSCGRVKDASTHVHERLADSHSLQFSAAVERLNKEGGTYCNVLSV